MQQKTENLSGFYNFPYILFDVTPCLFRKQNK